jgi:hypothetical protein
MLFHWVMTSLCFKRPGWALQGQTYEMLGTCHPATICHIQEDWNLNGKKCQDRQDLNLGSREQEI